MFTDLSQHFFSQALVSFFIVYVLQLYLFYSEVWKELVKTPHSS